MAWSDSARVVDVSHWNPAAPPNWQIAARDGGVVGAIVKFTQGLDGHDPMGIEHVYNAYSAGVSLLGCYHFGDGSDPEKQALSFLDAMHQEWGDARYYRMLMLDAEQNKPQMTVAMAEIFVRTVHDAIGRWPWYYGGKDGPDGAGHGLPSRILSNCPGLFAAYGPHDGNLAPLCPRGWRLPRDGADRGEPGMGVMRGWQYTDGTIHGGPIPGLGRVDQSHLVGFSSLAEAQALWAA